MTGNAGWFAYDGADVNAVVGLNYKYLPYNITTTPNSYESLQVITEGSSVNGPNSGSFGRTVSMFKKGFGDGSAKGGEMDNMYLVLRQDARDAVKADGCTILADIGVFDIDSFVGFMEGATTTFARADNTILRRMSYQIGCSDNNSGECSIYFGKAAVGVTKDALHFATEGNGTFTYLMRYQTPDHYVYAIKGSGEIQHASFTSGSSVWTWVDSAGTHHTQNHGQTVDLALLDQSGNLTLHSSVRANWLDLNPIDESNPANIPSIRQGRIWFSANRGKYMGCRDNTSWTEL